MELGITPNEYDVILKLLLSLGLGAIIGLERALKRRPAGLRTHMLVCLGSTLFTVMSVSFDVDPARIAAGIVAGIGFLGAGSIIAHRGHVRGITSAATLWVVAGIGLTVGLGEHIIALVGALMVFGVLEMDRKIQKVYKTKGYSYEE